MIMDLLFDIGIAATLVVGGLFTLVDSLAF